ncbi:beta-ketoacyl synthase N-terminal-like domain-containing protein [Enhygromyxa salina]|uniref:3-oxoacyl-[acyl-carrier-protein] synthase 2 n=1 Tax=Enhygromyxa salina TaxID=215803 RepID=A0A2S9YSM3_9BACT|nr:beta-ketoacyl synthase N-terminal-like domain-containing protein [Enhygromyxa salina]PRQ08070.1 3-oxoacyl-[acyl-carrier-protein] synthase 2 [Enhygromyxa salina]
MTRVWITGAGIVCGAGGSAAEVWAAMCSGVTAIGPVRRFSVPPGRNAWVASAAIEPTLKHTVAPDQSAAQLCLAMARHAAGQAAADLVPSGRAETALVWASNVEDHHMLMAELAATLADELGLDGPRLGVSVACASATLAVGIGARLVASGDAARVLVVASDVITPRVIAGFDQLGLLAETPCVPFSSLIGTSLGEGAGALLLESSPGPSGQGEGLRVSGWGSANDAHHPTQPHPGGDGVARALESALALAGCDPSLVAHVSAHGTGTAANDGAEWVGLSRALAGQGVAVSSLKSLVGHTQGACGLVELVASLIALEHDAHPPTIGFTQPRPGAPPDVVGPRPRVGGPRTLVSVNAGFGGSNAALVVTREPAMADSELARREVYICGAAVVDPTQVASLDLCRAVRGVDLRPLGTWTVALCVALGEALRAAGLRPSRRDPTGLFVGQAQVSLAQTQLLATEYAREGLYGASANIFTETFLGHPASACASALGLRGPFGVTTEGRCAGLVALVHAVEAAREGAARTMLAGELCGDLEHAHAVGLALDVAPRAGRVVRVVAHALAPATAGDQARRQVLERAGWDAASVEPSLYTGHEQPPLSQAAVARACSAIRAGEIERALIVDQHRGALACAIALEAHDVSS